MKPKRFGSDAVKQSTLIENKIINRIDTPRHYPKNTSQHVKSPRGCIFSAQRSSSMLFVTIAEILAYKAQKKARAVPGLYVL